MRSRLGLKRQWGKNVSKAEPKKPIVKGDYDAGVDDQVMRDVYERGMIVFASDFTIAKDDNLKRVQAVQGTKQLNSSAMAMKVALWVLHSYLGQNGERFPDIERIGIRMGCAERTAREAIADLVAIGAVAWLDKRPGFADRKYAIHYGRILQRWVSHPTQALQAHIKAEAARASGGAGSADSATPPPADSAGVKTRAAESAYPPGRICIPPRQIPPDPPADSAGQNIQQLGTPVNSSDNHRDGGGAALEGQDVGCSTTAADAAGSEPQPGPRTFQQQQQAAIDAIKSADWKLSARAFCRRLDPPVREDQIGKRIDQIGTEARFLEILKIIDWRRRKAIDDSEEFEPARMLCWLAERSTMTFAAFTSSNKSKGNQWPKSPRRK